ncbi:hypothetical protein OE88DRAFT_1664081 [Heliocybe sulcata]|uniref:Uncharacterized protein n=1 Tax=Heliocybe sulcata TaxID=5364 RepID=A0A5C3N538_9AGAM|nr:hypothetical protein OE88DRAFT_1664081 [Heliocybe sulcata]
MAEAVPDGAPVAPDSADAEYAPGFEGPSRLNYSATLSNNTEFCVLFFICSCDAVR